ncbi:MAG: polysaccharide deacetylase family protein [Firmicutes bacterium]|nr:polysaccharide deacetylase family protein [Bacillota bacterium]
MKVFVIEAKTVIKYFFVIAAAITVVSALSTVSMNAIGVYSPTRLLPIYSVDCGGKKASITFDCAWGANDIPDILNTLERENVKATFFIVGQWAEKNIQSVKMIADKGHDIANHSYSHLRMGMLDTERIEKEMLLCSQKLEEITGKKVELFRAPYGDYNNNIIKTARRLGYHSIQWDVDSLDWKPGISLEEIKNRVLRKVQPGSIILFHNDTPHTSKLLPEIISALKNKEYELVPVSKLIIRNNYYIDFDGRQKMKI